MGSAMLKKWMDRRRRAARSSRRLVSLPAKLRSPSGWADVVIVTVSETGLLVKGESCPAVGERVEVRHRSLSIHGCVVREEGRRLGIEADEPIDLGRLLAKAGIEAPGMDARRSDLRSRLDW